MYTIVQMAKLNGVNPEASCATRLQKSPMGIRSAGSMNSRRGQIMTEEVDGVLLTDGRNRIFLHPPEPYLGGGFHHQVDLVGGPFHGAIDAFSYEGPKALQTFHRQLVALYQSLKGEAELPHSYDNLKVSLSGDGLGHVTVRADAITGDYMDTRLSFTLRLDQTQLPPVIAAVERLFLRHPTPGT